ncbi:NAD-dependent epimerase/dehydratase family protein [Amycolatopsis sp. NPDC049868]|uniref:NAD-dependent epimerase/dehydratase family protein n=1 Tax=Amycolatopsis sp. NPDC049868 TaxID=3363934 RepID=UPI0037AAF877
MSEMNVVILGCGGYIGSHLLDHLLASEEYRVTGWDLETHKIEEHLGHPRLRVHREDLASSQALGRLREAVERADVVINLAAICNPAEYNTRPLTVLRANLFDLYPVMDLCAELNTWLIHFSTSEVYGRTLSSYVTRAQDTLDQKLYVLDERTTPLIMGPVHNQRWTYAAAKQVAERLIYAHHRENGLPFTIVRPLNFFGPRMDYLPGRDGEGTPRVLACFMAALLDGTPMQLVDGGDARRTIVSIDDAIDAVLRILRRPDRAQNRIFNIGNPRNEVTIRELAERMRETYASITGDPAYRDHPIVSVSAEEFYGPGYEDCDRRMPRIDNATTLLGWTPQKSLGETLDDTMRYYHAAYAHCTDGRVA